MFEVRFLVTNEVADIPEDAQIVMVDGTVPGWVIKPGDRHYDHHRAGGPDIQIDDIPDTFFGLQENACFVTTKLDEDAAAAAAWMILLTMNTHEGLDADLLDRAKLALRSIAYECDHLGLPMLQEFMELPRFARDAVATLKLTRQQLIKERGYPKDTKTWPRKQKVEFESFLFGRNVEWLISAALDKCAWPGQNGETAVYWHQFAEEYEALRASCRMYKKVGILEVPATFDYVDPRHLIKWVQCQHTHLNITLTVRQRPLKLWRNSLERELVLLPDSIRIPEGINTLTMPAFTHATVPAFHYTLGSVPLHPLGSPNFSDGRNLPEFVPGCELDEAFRLYRPMNDSVWDVLSSAEKSKRKWLGFPQVTTFWGGRNTVGGSSLKDSAVLMPEEVIDLVLYWNEHEFVPPIEF